MLNQDWKPKIVGEVKCFVRHRANFTLNHPSMMQGARLHVRWLSKLPCNDVFTPHALRDV